MAICKSLPDSDSEEVFVAAFLTKRKMQIVAEILAKLALAFLQHAPIMRKPLSDWVVRVEHDYEDLRLASSFVKLLLPPSDLERRSARRPQP